MLRKARLDNSRRTIVPRWFQNAQIWEVFRKPDQPEIQLSVLIACKLDDLHPRPPPLDHLWRVQIKLANQSAYSDILTISSFEHTVLNVYGDAIASQQLEWIVDLTTAFHKVAAPAGIYQIRVIQFQGWLQRLWLKVVEFKVSSDSSPCLAVQTINATKVKLITQPGPERLVPLESPWSVTPKRLHFRVVEDQGVSPSRPSARN